MKAVFHILLTFFQLNAFSQSHIKISGIVSEASINEKINGATVFYQQAAKSITTNDAGFFSLKVGQGDSCVLLVSHLDHETVTMRLLPSADTFLYISLEPLVKGLSEVVVRSSQRNTSISSISIPIEQLEKVPAFLGEKDVIKVIQLLPGVQSGQEGTTGYYVRGGGADQNLILLDGITVYNVSHLFGFFSLFPPETVKSVELVKGGFPARYGGRLSSVLDIKLKDGAQNHYSCNYSVGLLASKASIEGPIKKNKSSFIITARRTYFDVLAMPFTKNAGGYFFYDGIAKFNFTVNAKNRFFISAYNGNDKFYSTLKDRFGQDGQTISSISRTGFRWCNFTGALRWNQIVSRNLHLNYNLNVTQFRYNLSFTGNQTNRGTEDKDLSFSYNYFSSIRDVSFKVESDWFASNAYKLKSGLAYTQHAFIPSSGSTSRTEDGQVAYAGQSGRKIKPVETILFIESELNPTKRLSLNAGLHANLYAVEGKAFPSVQPRVSGVYKTGGASAIKFAYTYMAQSIHLLANNGPGLPTDLWVPATEKVPPQKAWQYSVGYHTALFKNYELTAEAYYKKMNRIIEYKEGSNFLNTALNWEERVERGRGESYGSELFLQKKRGTVSGWVGYTLSWSRRQFDNLNEGKPFYYKYDHRHDFKTVLIYEPGKNMTLSMNFVLNSGNRITLPDVFYSGAPATYPYNFPDFMFTVNNPNLIYNAGGRNNYRMKTYHRADLSADFRRIKKRGTRTWNISFYNVYCRLNPYFYYYRQKADGGMKLAQVSVFPVIPSISYGFKWN